MSLAHRLSALALRHLSPERFDALRQAYLGLRGRLAPAMRRLYGSFGAESLQAHLRERLGSDFEVLMVHCSMNNLQPAYQGDVKQLLEALNALALPDRTLVMPTFNFGDAAQGGAYGQLQRQPRVDLRRLPSQMGLLSELFRRTRGVVSSRHPVMRLSAVGPLAEELMAGHESAERPCGAGSPFEKMDRRRTLIVGIGRTVEVLTHVHHVEDLMGDAFPVPARSGEPLQLTLVDAAGEVPCVLPSRSLTWRRDMLRLRGLMPRGQLREWRFHGVPMFAVRAADVTQALRAAAAQGRTLYSAS